MACESSSDVMEIKEADDKVMEDIDEVEEIVDGLRKFDILLEVLLCQKLH